ncbi:helix-turn-helix domain-containing protein [Metapseudomonas furukawaii]|uniref:helix-turn-helix domain-containing protein n=1 Tax=Metapseudomonas furukawaii TaxID=1149133 RepID=UPI004045A7C1
MLASSFLRIGRSSGAADSYRFKSQPAVCNSVPADILLPVVEALLSRGVAVERIEAVFRCPVADLYADRLRLPLFLARRLWSLAVEECGDSGIGWQLGAMQSSRSLRGLVALFEAGSSIQQGFDWLQPYLPKFFGHLGIELSRVGRSVEITLQDRGQLGAAPQAMDFLHAWLSGLLQRKMASAGVAWPGGIELGMDRHVLSIPAQLFESELVAGQDDQAQSLMTHFDAMACSGHDGLLGAVCTYIARHLADGPSLEDFCQRYHLSERTLARQLRGRGWSFRSLLEEHRRYRAWDLLQDSGLDQGRIAAQLGYQDTCSFSRAFLRWYGCPPGECRPAVHS